MRQIFSVRFFAAVGGVVGLLFLLTTIFATRSAIDDAVGDDAEPAPVLRAINLVEHVEITRPTRIDLDADGLTVADVRVTIDRTRAVTISKGTPGEVHCRGLAIADRCAVVLDLLGEAVVWFAVVPGGPNPETVPLPAIDTLDQGVATLVNGWQLPYASVLDRRCGQGGDDERPSRIERILDEPDATQREVVFQNPGSPVVSSRGGGDAIVWVLDANRPRSAPLYGESAPQPVLYAFDAQTLALLWRSAPGELATSGKYNEPLVADGMVIVGTDRLQAFGLRDARRRPDALATLPAARSAAAAAASAGAPTPGTTAAPPDACGRLLYEARCAACHEQQRSDMPSRAALSARERAFIVDKLRFGSMQPQALGLTDADLESIARYLTARDVAAPLQENRP